MSGGEQQRVAIARALLHRPGRLFLDEATAALDETAEARLYALLVEHLSDSAMVSIAHRPGVRPFHTRQVDLGVQHTSIEASATVGQHPGAA